MRKSRLSRHKQNKLIELFVAGVTARTASELVNVNKNTAAYYFHRLHLLIYPTNLHLEILTLFTRILTVVMRCLMSVSLVIFASITVRTLQKIITT